MSVCLPVRFSEHVSFFVRVSEKDYDLYRANRLAKSRISAKEPPVQVDGSFKESLQEVTGNLGEELAKDSSSGGLVSTTA